MHRLTLFALLLLASLACSRTDGIVGEVLSDQNDPPAAPIECDSCQYPLVMVHGFLASGDTWTKFAQLFHSNGYQARLIHVFDWNSLNQFGGGNTVQLLDQFIDKVLAQTGAEKVRLMGHSAGGGVCYNYLSNSARAAKVDGYVHIGSSTQSGPAGPNGSEPTLNLWSTGDAIANGGDIPGAVNVMIPDKDHYQIATSSESFEAVWKFFHNNKPPQTLEITPEGPLVCIAGKVLYFGENTPLNGAKVEIWEVNPLSGVRSGSSPDFTFTTDEGGNWGPVNVNANTTYEFVATPPNASQRVIHYFREGIIHYNGFVYLRTIPPPPSLAGILLAGLPNNDNQAVLNVFSGSQAVLHGRDVLTVDGAVLSTPEYASAAKTAITYFLYDDGDGVTELTPVGAFGGFSFLNGVDMFFPPTPPGSIPIVFNDRQLYVRNIRSSNGVVVGVFD
jgi:Predicted acetyltransferases and hydrolases with the alpha/beta hydrolase fold